MTKLFDSVGMPTFYTKKNGATTSLNSVSGATVGHMQDIGGTKVFSDSSFQPYKYSQKCGATTVYKGMNGTLLGSEVDLGNGNLWLLNANGSTVGYKHKSGAMTTKYDSQCRKLGTTIK